MRIADINGDLMNVNIKSEKNKVKGDGLNVKVEAYLLIITNFTKNYIIEREVSKCQKSVEKRLELRRMVIL